ncbi:winged helix-turn-helix transcriptional regulator [Hoeflea poritis]|uniref:Winged helix-turn-helix transcriptional regulator n=1 Tax=Hoeflea poritis TaxID=2993659 RepID=A0ABT4VM19_9HYPH|nr:winged helix-turn-helix transcriptional regulator [Hoeflea poritis]MDA4845758.1 winged helix-turn-helix transcriptional regulator [Hoeflea poritis]
MDIETLVKLTSRAWSLSILAHMDRGVPGRQAALIAATGAGRTSFRQSLDHLIDLGLLERNPGHGHPLRPEFRLTDQGAEIARVAHRVEALAKGSSERNLLRRAWSLPILSASREPIYFCEIKARLLPITDRALSQSLKLLETHSWLQREMETSGRPLRPLYVATNAGAEISRTIGA